jgi:hypothetical protein
MQSAVAEVTHVVGYRPVYITKELGDVLLCLLDIMRILRACIAQKV